MYTEVETTFIFKQISPPIVFYSIDLHFIMPEDKPIRSSSPIFFHGRSQINTIWVSTVVSHLGFWFSLKMCKNVWNHIWRSEGAHFISQPSVWFMITKPFPDLLFKNWPQQKWKRLSSKDLENLENGYSWIKCLAWTLLSASQVHNTFQILKRLFWFWNNSRSTVSLDRPE